jgi:hypothetical protein
MVQVRVAVAFFLRISYGFFACKFLKMMYLNGALRSVYLKDQFIVTEKTRHSIADPSAAP